MYPGVLDSTHNPGNYRVIPAITEKNTIIITNAMTPEATIMRIMERISGTGSFLGPENLTIPGMKDYAVTGIDNPDFPDQPGRGSRSPGESIDC